MKIEKKLSDLISAPLSHEESAQMWINVQKNMTTQNKTSNLIKVLHNPLFTAAVILIILLTTSVATVQAADKSKPGDRLFGLDRAMERIELAMARKENKVNVQMAITKERVAEIDQMVSAYAIKQSMAANVMVSTSDHNSNNNVSPSDHPVKVLTMADVKVGPTKSRVKLEIKGRIYSFMLNTTNTDQIKKEILVRFKSFDRVELEKVIKFEKMAMNPPMEMPVNDRATTDDNETRNITSAVNNALAELHNSKMEAAYLAEISAKLQANIDQLPDDVKMKIVAEDYMLDIKVNAEGEVGTGVADPNQDPKVNTDNGPADPIKKDNTNDEVKANTSDHQQNYNSSGSSEVNVNSSIKLQVR